MCGRFVQKTKHISFCIEMNLVSILVFACLQIRDHKHEIETEIIY